MEILLYPLLFVLGYCTCKVSNIYWAANNSVVMIKVSQLSSLLLYTRAIEQYSYVRTFAANKIKSDGGSDKEVESFEKYVDNDIEYFKKQSIKQMNLCIAPMFSDDIKVADWDAGMALLESEKEAVQQIFINRSQDK